MVSFDSGLFHNGFYLRYVRTPLSPSYLMFLHPFVFLLSGWMIWIFLKKTVVIGILLFAIIVAGSLYKDFLLIKTSENYSAREAERNLELLSRKFPDEKFSVYSYKYKWADKNLILTLYLDVIDKIHSNGKKIGIVIATESAEFGKFSVISGEEGEYQIIDLSSSTSAQLSEDSWVRVNPEDIYKATQEWYDKRE